MKRKRTAATKRRRFLQNYPRQTNEGWRKGGRFVKAPLPVVKRRGKRYYKFDAESRRWRRCDEASYNSLHYDRGGRERRGGKFIRHIPLEWRISKANKPYGMSITRALDDDVGVKNWNWDDDIDMYGERSPEWLYKVKDHKWYDPLILHDDIVERTLRCYAKTPEEIRDLKKLIAAVKKPGKSDIVGIDYEEKYDDGGLFVLARLRMAKCTVRSGPIRGDALKALVVEVGYTADNMIRWGNLIEIKKR